MRCRAPYPDDMASASASFAAVMDARSEKLASSAFGKAAELYLWPLLREHAGSLIVGLLVTAFGGGAITVSLMLAFARTWIDAHPLATAGLGGLAVLVIGLVLFWRAAKSISRSAAGARPAPAALTPAAFDWTNPAAVLTAQLEHPVFRGNTRALEATVVLITFRELPSGTKVIRWSAGFTMNGIPVGKAEEDGADMELRSSGKTILGRVGVIGFPVAPFGAAGVDWRNIGVAATFVAELREPGRVDPIILKVETVPQVLMVN